MNDKPANQNHELPVVTREKIAEELGRPTSWVDDRILSNLHTGDLGDGCVITPKQQYHDFLLGLCYPTSGPIDDWIEHKEAQELLRASRSSVDRLASRGAIRKEQREKNGKFKPFFSRASIMRYLQKKQE